MKIGILTNRKLTEQEKGTLGVLLDLMGNNTKMYCEVINHRLKDTGAYGNCDAYVVFGKKALRLVKGKIKGQSSLNYEKIFRHKPLIAVYDIRHLSHPELKYGQKIIEAFLGIKDLLDKGMP